MCKVNIAVYVYFEVRRIKGHARVKQGRKKQNKNTNMYVIMTSNHVQRGLVKSFVI